MKAAPKSLQRRNSWRGMAKGTAEIGVLIIQTPNQSCTQFNVLGSDRIGSVHEKFDLNPGPRFHFSRVELKLKSLVTTLYISFIICSIKISSMNYVFFPLLSKFYKSKSSKTLSEHWHSQTVNHWIYDGIAHMNHD